MVRHALLLGLALTLGSEAVATRPAAAQKPAGKPATATRKKPAYDETKLKALEARLTKQPKDQKLKTEVAEANFQVGYTYMNNENLPPRVKYRTALKHYRRALALNPKHAAAKENAKLIEDIYRSMGMPVP